MGSWEDLHTKEMDTGQLEGLVRHARAKSEPAVIVGSVPVEVEAPVVRAKGSITIKREAIPIEDTEQIQRSFTYPTAPGSAHAAMFAILIVAVAAGAIVAAILLR